MKTQITGRGYKNFKTIGEAISVDILRSVKVGDDVYKMKNGVIIDKKGDEVNPRKILYKKPWIVEF